MQVRSGGKSGPQVAAPPAVVEAIAEQLRSQQAAWLQQLTEQPERFADLEVRVHHAFQQLADQLVAGLLAQASQQSSPLDTAKKK
jgi:hypothetical protein